MNGYKYKCCLVARESFTCSQSKHFPTPTYHELLTGRGSTSKILLRNVISADMCRYGVIVLTLLCNILSTISFLPLSYVNTKNFHSFSIVVTRRLAYKTIFGKKSELKSDFLARFLLSADDNVQDSLDLIAKSEVDSTLLKLRELRNELDTVRKEHGIMNNNTDVLGPSAQYGGNTQFALAALKKRKLALKDRISYLESLLNKRRKLAKEVFVNPNKTLAQSHPPPASSDISKHRSEVR